MGTLIVELKISDFTKFTEVFPKGEAVRNAGGITNSRAFRGIQDPNSIIVISDASDEGKARAALGSDEVRSLMQAASIIGPPRVLFF
jgi:hypothetical protein